MLDFYLLGLARSGTTALCNALNLHPNIYCGMERFSIPHGPSSIIFPNSFLDKKIRGNPLGHEHARKNLEAHENLNTFKVIGDKLPRKIYCPSHITKTKSNIFIYRSYVNVTQSWDARAKNPIDGWSKARTGLFLFFDLLLYFEVLRCQENTTIVNFDELFFGNFGSELQNIFECLNLNSDDYPLKLFETGFFSRKTNYLRSSDDNRYNTIADHIGLREFENEFFNADNSQRLRLVKEYGDFINENSTQFLDYLTMLVQPREHEELFHLTNLIERNFTIKDRDKYFSNTDSKFDLIRSIHRTNSDDKLLKVIGLFPEFATPYAALSRGYGQRNDLDQALDKIRKAIDLNGDNPHYHFHHGNILMRKGDLEGAEKAQNNAIKLNPTIPAPRFQLSRVYAKRNELNRAIDEVRKAIELGDDNPSFHSHLENLIMRKRNLNGA